MRSHRRRDRGQVLIGVILLMVLVSLLVPTMVEWIRQDTRASVKDQKSTLAFNLAEAGIDRGVWRLKSSTTSWFNAVLGVVTTGYNLDVSYDDIPGGFYRVRFSSGPSSNQVTLFAEGRDSMRKETRAIQAVYSNSALPGPLLTSGVVTHSGALEIHWGPILAQNNINISGNAATEYFPRKFSKQVVQGTMGQPRDTNGLTAPNTDNVEWWSDYDVPDLPLLDFATLRASAAANGTLNYYNGSASSHTMTGYSGGTHGNCYRAGTFSPHPNPHSTHFLDSNHHPLSKNNLIWYWDGDVVFVGGFAPHNMGLYGTVIVRGNLTIETEDSYSFAAPVPTEAWREYARIGTSQWDTATTNQYPADTGLQSNAATFNIGSQTWTGGPPAAFTDVGFRGFVYVGGNFTIIANAKADFNGVIWVNGNFTNANVSERSLLFYDQTLGANLPVLNVVLTRQSWQETAPSATAWP